MWLDMQFLLRSSILVNYSFINFPEVMCLISIVIFVLWAVGVLMFKPYKRELHNVLEAILSTYYVFASLLLLFFYVLLLKGTPQYPYFAGITILVTPGILFGVHVLVQVLMHCGCHTKLFSCLRMLYKSASEHAPILKWSGINSTDNNTSPPIALVQRLLRTQMHEMPDQLWFCAVQYKSMIQCI